MSNVLILLDFDYGDGDDEHCILEVSKSQAEAAKDAIRAGREKWPETDLAIYDCIEDELKKRGVRYDFLGYWLEVVDCYM